MIKLHARLSIRRDQEPLIVRIVRHDRSSNPDPYREACFLAPGERPGGTYRAYLASESVSGTSASGEETWPVPRALEHLTDGDIVRISPRSGELWVMYRRKSRSNSMLLTEQCNSNCVMCSQPPKTAADRHLLRAYLEAIPLMSPETVELGITGGEPTLLGEGLIDVIRTTRDCLPGTALHMLSNGRLFNYLSLCQAVAAVDHPDFMIGIPLYSDIAHRHDFVVQAEGAFDQTLRGVMNLARCRQRVEIRIVLHRATVDRLPQVARFIARNLPFVDHVAFMGLEMMGYVKMNLEALWIEPKAYQSQLRAAVDELLTHGMNVSIYNHQLCLLDRPLWPAARQSISDWKNEYVAECGDCAVRDQCGGFFASASLRMPEGIRPLKPAEFVSPRSMPAQSTSQI